MIRQQISKKTNWLLIIIFSLAFGLGFSTPVFAQSPSDENEDCLTCHSNPDLSIEFASGDTLNGYVSRTQYQHSVHGEEAMTCGGCHPDHQTYPHPEIASADARAYTLAMNDTCLECHPDQSERVQDSVHTKFLAEGKTTAAVCVDCHGAHNTQSLSESRVEIAQACQQCHAGIYTEYNESVHGKALREDGNTDVPTCVDCHGVHHIEDPRTAEYRLNSPNLCGSCHADETLMSKYDISTNVFETYVADFHGTTVTLFEKLSPDQPTNKAVCYDCHGVHNIMAADAPNSSIIKENLLVTCQKCHPDATANFPDTWTSHFAPTFEKQPLVAAVNWFYAIIIPGVIGFMGIFVILDAGHRIFGKKNKPHTDDNSQERA